ncbi:uncharacterized protein LOC111333046 [Stylophora pistillata]|uniref:uncharacterized protein LOC111333046 n=1 Tax=Stylophora pistillata TaxID=50429 RepID=UPI000C045FE3|nr:uncharacterized protein LOC111333046 [Stylophora pistillata]
MNINFLKFNTHVQTEEFLDMLYANNILPIITKPTRLTDHTATLIDHIYTNCFKKLTAGILTVDLTDHLPIFCIVKTQPTWNNDNKIYFRDYSKFKKDLYLDDINQIAWHEILNPQNNLNEKLRETINILNEIVDKHAPIRLASQSEQKQLNKPWLTKAILKSVKRKQKMYRTYYLSNVSPKKGNINIMQLFFHILRIKVRQTIIACNSQSTTIILNKLGNLSVLLLKGKQEVKLSLQKLLSHNNRTYSQEKDIAQLFNNFFVNIGPTLAQKIKPDHTNPLQYIESTPSNSFYLAPATLAQVFTLFAGLKENKASLTVPNKLIKLAAEQLSAPFTEIYNESKSSGEFPEVFQISKVTLILKSRTVSELGNYRPIAVISPFSKVLERLVYDQLVSYLEKECLLFNYQFGFPKGYSMEYAILETVENLKSAIDSQQITCGIFLDFSKAFDTINHHILLGKLYKYGIRGVPHAWFSSYITNHK